METEKEKVQMKNFKKYLLAFAGILVFVGFGCGIAGCSSGSNDGGDKTSVVTPPPVDTPPVGDNGLPPDPGEAGKATREGVDSNSNKVRDDMEIAIYERHPNDELKRDALMRDAFVLQKAMLAGGAILDGNTDKDEAFRVSQLTSLSSGCLVERFGYDAYKEGGFIEAILTNTDDRGRAYDMYNTVVVGTSGLPDTDTPCQRIDL